MVHLIVGTLAGIAAFFINFSYAQVINASTCGIEKGCYRSPAGCGSSTTCDILITFKYKSSDNAVDIAVSSTKAWVAFGLCNTASQMDATSGEVCFKDSSLAKLKAFSNNGYFANFNQATNGLISHSNSIVNGAVICRYQRPVTPSAGSYMKDLKEQWFITAGYGDTVSASSPTKHTATPSSSSSKVDLRKSFEVSGSSKANTNVVVHGCLMVIAWLSFAATGMFLARYMKPVGKDSLCLGQKIWFQSHRICMISALLFTIISFIIIFVHKKGWSEHAKAHPVTGCITVFLAIIQPIMAIFRPHPDENNRWIFNWMHRCVGIAALILAVVTIFLGLNLMRVTLVSVIVWAALFAVIVLIMEIGPCFIPNVLSDEYDMDANRGAKEGGKEQDDKTILFRKIMFAIGFTCFFAVGFTTVGLIATS